MGPIKNDRLLYDRIIISLDENKNIIFISRIYSIFKYQSRPYEFTLVSSADLRFASE